MQARINPRIMPLQAFARRLHEIHTGNFTKVSNVRPKCLLRLRCDLAAAGLKGRMWRGARPRLVGWSHNRLCDLTGQWTPHIVGVSAMPVLPVFTPAELMLDV